MNKEQILEDFKSGNDSIDETLTLRILDDKFLALFPLYVLEYSANYPIIQDKLLSLTNSELNILSKIINYAIYEKQDWSIPAAEYITFIENPNYEELHKSIEGKLLNNIEITSLLFLTRNYGNFYNVTDYQTLSKLSELRRHTITKHENNPSPEVILLTKYGISYKTAMAYFNRYGKDTKYLPDSPEKNFLIDIDNILHGKGTDNLLFDDYQFINNLNSRLSNLYGSIYSAELYKLEDKNFIQNIIQEGISIPIYNAGEEFTMSINSIGMASNETPENYYESWNQPTSKVDHFCNSIITSRSMKTSVKNCVFGFASYENNDLKLVAPNDLGTGGVYNDPLPNKLDREQRLIADVSFRIPSELENNTRFTNNEVYRARRRVVNDKLVKVNPDYLVYLKQESDIDIKNDPIWQQTLKASIDFYKATNKPLPIVVVDCEACLIHNVEMLNSKIIEFGTHYDNQKLLQQIIELIHTLRMGYSNNIALTERYLNSEVCYKALENILSIIDSMSDIVPNLSISHLELIRDILDLEYIKLNASPYWIKKYCGKNKTEKNVSINNLIEQKINRIKKKQNSNQIKT